MAARVASGILGPRQRGDTVWRSVRVMAVAAAALGALVAPGAARGGLPDFTFVVTISSSCLSGTGPPSASIDLTLRDRDGRIKDRDTAQSDSGGNWSSECFWYDIFPTDRIRAESGAMSRTFTVPKVTANTDRVTDVVSGRAPTTGTLQIETQECHTYLCQSGPTVLADVSSNGTYAEDFTALTNLRGRDRVIGHWSGPSGDTVHTPNRNVPFLSVGIGEPRVGGTAPPGTLATVRLRTASGDLLAVGSDPIGYDNTSISIDFETASGLPVYPRPGHKVKANIASDAKLTVPEITLAADTVEVSGMCFPNADVYVYLEQYDPYDWTDGYTTADGTGAFTLAIADTQNSSYTLTGNDRWEVDCQNAKGDIVYRFGRF